MSHSIYRETQLNLRRRGVVGRRDFLKSLSAGVPAGAAIAAGGLSWTDAVSVHAEEMRRNGLACILLWMGGGPSQMETFDPKPGHANGGETKAIDTATPGLQISENLPEIAKISDRLAVVRSMTTKEGNHQRATYMLHTSYVPTATLRHPTLGSIVSHEIVNGACELPAFVRIGQGRFGSAANGGFLGTGYDAFEVGGARGGPQGGGANRPAAPVRPNNTTVTTSTDRYNRRLGLLGKLEAAAENPALAPAAADHEKLYGKASRMILSPQMQAFDLAQESEQDRALYGDGEFAQGCLLARRLVETGVTFVEVGLGNWDTHQNNFDQCRQLCGQLDRPMAGLIRDLEQRGMLDRTLVVWMGEFGRTPRINPRGGRDHFPRAFTAALAGCGIRGSQVLGRSSDSGEDVADRPVTEKDLFRTIYQALKIDAGKEFMSPIGRPIKIVDGGEPVTELFG